MHPMHPHTHKHTYIQDHTSTSSQHFNTFHAQVVRKSELRTPTQERGWTRVTKAIGCEEQRRTHLSIDAQHAGLTVASVEGVHALQPVVPPQRSGVQTREHSLPGPSRTEAITASQHLLDQTGRVELLQNTQQQKS
jgi:hypothetical protein